MLVANNRGEKMLFTAKGEDVIYKNPYGDKKVTKVYKRHNPYVCEMKGGFIVKALLNQFDYVVNGVCITQRVCASMELLKLLISENVKPCDYTHLHEINKMLETNHV